MVKRLIKKEDNIISGNSIGAKKAVEKLKAKDPDHFKKIGAKGGQVSTPTGGFGYGEQGREKAREAGRKGGRVSRRKK